MPIDDGFKFMVLSNVRTIGEEFENPDDDWHPVLVMHGYKDGEEGNALVPLMFSSDEEKFVYANFLMPGLARMAKADLYATVTSNWTVTIDRPGMTEEEMKEIKTYEDLGEPQPKYHPDRREEMVVFFGSSDGSQELWHAEITRSETEPPTLGEWEIYNDGPFGGQMIEPIQKVVVENYAEQGE